MTKLLTISLTSKCNRSCVHCPMAKWRNNPDFPDKLTLEETKSHIENLKPTYVEITGGEPTLVAWLDELLNFLEEKGIAYLVKSNGIKRCRNQVTAWHDNLNEPPSNYDKILIIKDLEGWERKLEFCAENGIPHAVIGKDENDMMGVPFMPAQQLFLCPDGRFKQCHERELFLGKPEWFFMCPVCKAVNDFFVFLD